MGDAVELHRRIANIPGDVSLWPNLAAVFVVWPRATVPAACALLGVGVVLGIYGGMLGLDQKLRDLPPFTHSPVTTTIGTDWSGGFWMLGIAAVLTAFSLVAVRRREVGTA